MSPPREERSIAGVLAVPICDWKTMSIFNRRAVLSIAAPVELWRVSPATPEFTTSRTPIVGRRRPNESTGAAPMDSLP